MPVVFVTGVSGAGKTTLAQGLKTKHGYTHFDGDVYSFGEDPIALSGTTASAEWTRDPVIAQAYKEMVQAWTSEDITPFKTFYTMFCRAVMDKTSGVDNVVVSHSVYRRSVRDYIREVLPNVVFVLLDIPLEMAGARKVKNIEDACLARNQTLNDFFRSFHPDKKDVPDVPEDELKRQVIAHNTATASGFETRADDESNTVCIRIEDGMTRDQVLRAAVNALHKK